MRRLMPIVVAVAVVAGSWLGIAASGANSRTQSVQAGWISTLLEEGSDFWGTSATAINEHGQIIGKGLIGDSNYRAFIWQNGKLTALGTLAPGSSLSTFPRAINDSGQIVGRSETGTGVHAFLWQRGRMRDLGTLAGKTSSEAVAINMKGQVTGISYVGEGGQVSDPRAFLWQKGRMTDLGTLGGKSSSAVAINDKGQIVGWSKTKTGVRHAFLWQNGRMRDLGTLPGKKWSTAIAVNSQGQIVGDSFTRVARPNGIAGIDYTNGELGSRAFLWEKGRMVALTTPVTTLSAATAINDRGQITGHTVSIRTSGTVSYEVTRAFLWHNGRLSYLAMPGGDSYSDALALNNRGQVVGFSGVVGAYSAYIWEDGRRTQLPNPGGMGHDDEVTASAISEHGQVIGTRTATMDSARAVLWTKSP